MRRLVVEGPSSLVFVAVTSAAAVATPAGAQGDVQAFCQARVEANQRAGSRRGSDCPRGDPNQATRVQAAASLADLRTAGTGRFRDEEGRQGGPVVEQVHGGRELRLPVSDVSAIDCISRDVRRRWLPASGIPVHKRPGPRSSTNSCCSTSTQASTCRPESCSPSRRSSWRSVRRSWSAFALPGDDDTLIAWLEPGRYVYACLIEVGTTSGVATSTVATGTAVAAKPHWKRGMFGELEVTGGA